jgi:hypothetical protein
MDYGDGFDVGLPCVGEEDEVTAFFFSRMKNQLN